jgi:hypothetical protein
MLNDDLDQVYITALEGLGASYRMKGYFTLRLNPDLESKIPFEGVAFGGNYGGHNVNVTLAEEDKKELIRKIHTATEKDIEDLLTEVQRRLLNNEMVVEYDSIKPEIPEDADGLGGI